MTRQDIASAALDDATRIRPATEDDELRVAALARALSQDSIRRRFLGGVARAIVAGELSREIHAGTGEIAFIAEDGDGAIAGEAYAALVDATSAEAAFVVADRRQHHGIGTRLFAAVVRALSKRGVQTMLLETLAENAEMIGIVQASGLPHVQRRTDEIVELRVSLPAAAR